MDSGASWSISTQFAKYISYDDLLKLKRAEITGTSSKSVVQRLQIDAKINYELVCLPLTTPDWKNRWQAMCIANSTISRTSSRMSLSVSLDAALQEKERMAENWRSSSSFNEDEVTITTLGMEMLDHITM
jgi:type II protein arginine methyltransferase